MANPFRVDAHGLWSDPQGCRWRSNPGLELANAFGVNASARNVPDLIKNASTPKGLSICAVNPFRVEYDFRIPTYVTDKAQGVG